MISRKFACGALAALAAAGSAAEPPPTSAFARLPELSGVTISPDGQRIAYLTPGNGMPVLGVAEISSGASRRGMLQSVAGGVQLQWCRFKTATRLLCSFDSSRSFGRAYVEASRLVAIDSDGGRGKMLLESSRFFGGTTQDRVLSWLPRDPRRVLVLLMENGARYPGIHELDVEDGSLRLRTGAREPFGSYASDWNGDVRIRCGYVDTSWVCEGSDATSHVWRPLTKYEPFSRAGPGIFRPLGFGPDLGFVYMGGDFEGREALWRVDLSDRETPQLAFMHAAVDIETTVRDPDGRVLGVRYETDRPQVHYLDSAFETQMNTLAKAIPDRVLTVVSRSADGTRIIIRARSDVDAGTFYLYDSSSQRLLPLGREYPELPPERIAHLQSIEYPARDGTRIPGYLSVPMGVRAEHLPLVVMPHGGPRARSVWGFNFLRAFLVSRGYAVLEMNFRGSSGYGGAWLFAAHQDWGGLTYDDIHDGASWAIAQGIADPARVAIVGWSFGGYAALLGAVRDGGLFRCAVSIAGLSSLTEIEDAPLTRLGYRLTTAQLGSDRAKLERDSPREHAADVRMPVLLVHGTRDWTVNADQSVRMAAALEKSKKPHELLLLEGERHEIAGEKARTQLLEAVERFLKANLGPGTVSPPT